MDAGTPGQHGIRHPGRLSPGRAVYRLRQTWLALGSRPAPADLQLAAALLGPHLFELFSQMQPSEQAHSLQVLQRLPAGCTLERELVLAALLHDCGKIRQPLRLWERAWIVLLKTWQPARARAWGAQPLARARSMPFWQRPLLTAEQHAAWGAELAEHQGAPALTCALIRYHQDRQPPGLDERARQLLVALQAADDMS